MLESAVIIIVIVLYEQEQVVVGACQSTMRRAMTCVLVL